MARRVNGTDVLAVWQEAAEDEDRLRSLVQHLLQRMLQEEMTALLGAEAYERTTEREVKAITEQLCDLTISKSQASVLAKGLAEEILAVYDLPEGHRKRMRSTNMLERFNQELKRRTRVVRIFPNAASCLRLIGAMAIETNEEWLARRYVRMDLQEDEAVAEEVAGKAA